MVRCCHPRQSRCFCSLISTLNLDFEIFTLLDLQLSVPVCYWVVVLNES